jgi:hypothetical protein
VRCLRAPWRQRNQSQRRKKEADSEIVPVHATTSIDRPRTPCGRLLPLMDRRAAVKEEMARAVLAEGSPPSGRLDHCQTPDGSGGGSNESSIPVSSTPTSRAVESSTTKKRLLLVPGMTWGVSSVM